MALAHLISDVRASGITVGENDLETSITGKEVSELELLTTRRRLEDKKKAQRHWSLLRDSIQNVRRAVEQADSRDTFLVHGIHHDRKLNHTYPIQHAIFIPQKKEYLTSDGETVWKFYEDGRKKEMITPEEAMDRIIFSSQTNQYVGWQHKEDILYLMNSSFEIKSQSQTVGKIHLGVYNNNTGEMITVGPGFITCWAFRYGARHLIPRKTTTTEFVDGNMFSMMVLEETASRSQRIFFGCGNGVVVYNIFEGRQLVHRKELHVRPITAITFFNPLKYLITGAMDGCIKVWDSDWCIKMVFVGHSNAISSLAIYPHGPLFISAARDCTVRVWSMETCDEVDKTSIAEPVQGLFTSPRYDVFFTFAGKKVDLWRLNHLYHIQTNIGHRVNTIKLTSHPFFPVRAVLMCRDSSVRIVSPAQGEVLTTLIMPPFTGLIDAAYAIAENVMFTVCGNGDIIKCQTDVNPCKVLARWKCPSIKEVCSCLLVYEYVMDMDPNVWAVFKRSVATKTVSNVGSSRNRTLLLGGRKDGYICVYNWETGAVDFKVEAHGSKGVLNMIANSKLDQLVSAGMDNVIKVWRLYPFAEEALAPLMSFYCAHTPAYMSTIKSNLCVAFQDSATATFNIVLYNLPEKKVEGKDMSDLFSEKNRHDHKPDDDHVDTITGLTSCTRMKLFASSSMDGTIRVWNDENKLVRVLRLNAIPNSISFCSPRGDLLVGIGLHLFHIPWHRYLPKPYLRKMVSMRFVEPQSEEALAYDEDLLSHMDKNDVKRLKGSHASFKVVHFEDELSKEEADEVMREKRIREKAFSEIEVRENELGLIRDGGKSALRKPKQTKRTQKEAMKSYMKLFYDKERIQIPPDDPYPADTLRDKLEAEADDQDEDYRPETAPINFFQEVNRNRTPGSAGHGISPIGFVPNSVLVKILYPPPSPPPDPASLRPYRPPELTAKQLSEIRALKKSRDLSTPRRSVTFADKEESFDLSKRTLDLDLDEEEEEKALAAVSEDEGSGREATQLSEKEKSSVSEVDGKSEGVPSVGEIDPKSKSATPQSLGATTPHSFPSTPARRKSKKKATIEEEEDDEDDDDAFWGGPPKSREQSNLMSKFKDIMDKPPSPKPEELDAAEAEQKPPEEKPKPVLREVQQPLKPIKKLVSRPRQKIPTPPPPKSPTPPPPPTPLPDFITQFVGTEWFEKYFPNCNETTMPKPWNGDHFVNMIMKLLRFATFPHKTNVAEAIVLVHTQEILSEATCHAVQKMLLTALNHHTNTPSCAEPEQKTFILAAIKGLQAMGICDKEFVVEMLVQFLDGDREVRTTVMDILNSIGLQDPHRQLQKELDSWDIWNMEDADRKKDLKKMCSQWLDRWMTSYKLHIKDAVERLQKGQNLHGRMRRGSMAPRASIAGGSRRGSVMPDSDTVTSLGGGDMNRPSTRGSMTLTIDRPDMALADHATYFEAMNYFCEMMTEKELEALRRGENLRRGAQEEQVVQAKNTVLVLPKIAQKPALVRLGETHTSQCRQSRDTGFSADYQQVTMLGKGKQPAPGQLTGFVPCINLPMKAVYLNPFPSPIDVLDPLYSQPILITLKSSQKYFIPAQSIVPKEMQVAPSS